MVSGCLRSRFKDTLENVIGHRAAERALQLGLLFPPAEALQVGIVDQVVPEEQVQSTALSAIAQWMTIPGEAQGMAGADDAGETRRFSTQRFYVDIMTAGDCSESQSCGCQETAVTTQHRPGGPDHRS